MAELLSAATGLSFSSEQLLHLAERVSNVERAFNVREGLGRSADTLPDRLLETPSAGQVVELDALLDDFYAECGWDLTTGIPTPDRLRDLALEEFVADLETLPATGTGT
jgi:aldehyde:ferredoxin oxidoreductase